MCADVRNLRADDIRDRDFSSLGVGTITPVQAFPIIMGIELFLFCFSHSSAVILRGHEHHVR